MKRTTIDELPSWARELLRAERVGHLGLLDGTGAPRVLPVTFVLHDRALWTAVDRKPKRDSARLPSRVRYLRRDGRAALTVDRYTDDWRRLAWVQVLGRVAIHEAGEAGEALAALAEKYPQYRTEPPPGPVLRLAPRRVMCWSAEGG